MYNRHRKLKKRNIYFELGKAIISILFLIAVGLITYKVTLNFLDIRQGNNQDDFFSSGLNEDSLNNNQETGNDTTVVAFYSIDSTTSLINSITLNLLSEDNEQLYFVSIPEKSKLNDLSISDLKYSDNMTDLNGIMYDLLGQEIDYYMAIYDNHLEYLIDLLGGIELEVPKRIIELNSQDQSVIDLQPGYQNLNGMQVVGLLASIESNGSFQELQEIKKEIWLEIINKITKVDSTLVDNIVEVLINEITTDFDKKAVVEYKNHIKAYDSSNIQFLIAPGYFEENEDSSEYIINSEAFRQLVENIDQKKSDVKEDIITEDISSIGYNIEILNSTGVAGLAAQYKDKLENKGFTVANVDNYTQQLQKTKIIVPQEGMGSDLQEFFNEPEIEVNEAMSNEEIDIQIIIGEDQ